MMIRRRNWIGSILAGGLAALPWYRSSAQTINTNTQNSAGLGAGNTELLEEQLVTTLRVFTKGQRLYIKAVVALVEQRKLPRALVNLVARWAVERNSGVPFPYFQFALRDLARRRRLPVP